MLITVEMLVQALERSAIGSDDVPIKINATPPREVYISDWFNLTEAAEWLNTQLPDDLAAARARIADLERDAARTSTVIHEVEAQLGDACEEGLE